nr:mechanosensitive ion channel domain-containing protein [Variovorax boronicumulans]
MPTSARALFSPSAGTRARLLCGLLWLAAWLAPWPATAQQPPAAASAAAPPAAPGAGGVAPIPVGAILARADEDQGLVDRARQLLAAPDPTPALAQALESIAAAVDGKQRASGGVALSDLPVMRLESLGRHWQFDERRFDAWQARAQRSLSPYGELLAQLAQRRAAWAATRAEGLLDNLPAVLATRVQAMLDALGATEAALSNALDQQVALHQRASELKARIQAGGAATEAAIDEIDRRLLRRDVPPLWEEWPALGTPGQAVEQMERSLGIETRFAADYQADASSNVQALRLLELLLLPLVLWLTWRSRPAARPGDLHVERALRRPVSTWLLLSMLAVLVLEPDAPLLVAEAALLVALVPVLRLLPAGVLQALGHWPHVAIGLYLADRLGGLLSGSPGLYRLYLLALTLLALGLTWQMQRAIARMALARGAPAASGTPGAPEGRLRQAGHWAGWLVLVLLGISAACNLGGNVTLSETLTSGVIDSGYFALMLYAAVAASLGLVHALLRQPELARRRAVQQHAPQLLAACRRVLMLVAALGWLAYTMERLRVLRPAQQLGAAVLGVGVEVGEVSIHLGDVLVFVLAVWLAWWAARGVRGLLREELHGHARLPRGVGNSIATLSYYGVLVLGFLVALSAAGFKVSQLTLVFGALGVGIGFGLQNVVNHFVSGLVLMFERPIQPGDIVEAAGISGTVREIGLRATTLRTFEGADVVVPNGVLLGGNLVNWTLFDRSRRIEVPVGVAYGSDPAQVLALLVETARGTPGVASTPEPVAVMTGLGDSALNCALRVWTRDVNDWVAVRSALLVRVLAALDTAGVAIPFPQREVRLLGTAPVAADGDAPAARAP